MTNNSLKKMQLALATLALSAYCCSAVEISKLILDVKIPLKVYKDGELWENAKLRNWHFEGGKLHKLSWESWEELNPKSEPEQTYEWTKNTRVTLYPDEVTITNMEFKGRRLGRTKTKTLKLLKPTAGEGPMKFKMDESFEVNYKGKWYKAKYKGLDKDKRFKYKFVNYVGNVRRAPIDYVRPSKMRRNREATQAKIVDERFRQLQRQLERYARISPRHYCISRDEQLLTPLERKNKLQNWKFEKGVLSKYALNGQEKDRYQWTEETSVSLDHYSITIKNMKKGTKTKTLKLLVPSGTLTCGLTYKKVKLSVRERRFKLLRQFQSKVVDYANEKQVTYSCDIERQPQLKANMAFLTQQRQQNERKPKTSDLQNQLEMRIGKMKVNGEDCRSSKPETRRRLQAELTQPEIPQVESSSMGLKFGPAGIALFSYALLVGAYLLFRYLQRKRGTGYSPRLPSIPEE